MIYCNIKGGLGNVLFQIAAMESLAFDNNDIAVYPNFYDYCKFLDDDNFHNPTLNYACSDYPKILNLKPEQFADVGTSGLECIKVPFEYEPLQYKEGCLYEGFFQSAKWFDHNRKYLLDNVFKFIAPRKNEFDAVAMHVRRGDFLKLSDTHVVQQLEYYKQAMAMFPKGTRFMIFTDDKKWCSENFDCKIQPERRDYMDIYLGASCKHQIICNSSFSWWMAYLNPNPDKIVIAPKNWFGAKAGVSAKDIYCEKWITI